VTYGDRLRELRAERRLSLREVEERGGPNKDTMSLIERGVHKPYPQTLGRIAQALDMDVSLLRAELEAAEYPLAQAPLEPSFNDVLAEERRQSMLTDAITAAAEAWVAALSNPNITIQKRFGIRDAAIELFEQINARTAGRWETLPTEMRRDIVGAMAALNEVPEESYRLMPEETVEDARDVRREERREQIREWTRRISA
jgi:transcriptional regulator with XRE-family HTH domain